MTQSRAMSGLEAVTNVVVGWVVALGTQALVFPVMGLSCPSSEFFGKRERFHNGGSGSVSV